VDLAHDVLRPAPVIAAGSPTAATSSRSATRPCSPTRWFSERAFYYPGGEVALGAADLPALDAVRISHYHCDFTAFAAYRGKDVPMITADPVATRHGRPGSPASACSIPGKPRP
jgi:hypothetical protein